MKTLTLILALLLSFGCVKKHKEPVNLSTEDLNEQRKTKFGKVLFWTDKRQSESNTLQYIVMIGFTEKIVLYSDSDPDCNKYTYSVYYQLAEGQYNYTIYSSKILPDYTVVRDVELSKGVVTITEGQCASFKVN